MESRARGILSGPRSRWEWGNAIGGIAGLLLLWMTATPASAFDPVRTSPPQRWIVAVRPEEGKKLELPEYFNALDTARAQLMAGYCKRAIYTLYDAPEDLDPVEVAVVRARALSIIGRGDEALQAVADERVTDAPAAQLARAAALQSLGKLDDAFAELQSHLKAHPDSLAGHFHLGALAEEMGDLKTAEQAYGWFFAEPQRYDLRLVSQPDEFDNAEEVTFIARALDRHSLLTGAYTNNPGLHNLILNLFVRAYDVIDRTYWPARLAAAEYFLSHDDEASAREELDAVLRANPRQPEALALLAGLSIGQQRLPQAYAYIEQLRGVNPHSVEADILDAGAMLRLRQPHHAAFLARRACERHPKSLVALGTLAAAEAMRLEDEACAQVLSRADQIAPQSPTALVTLADHLHAAWQFERAEKYYLAAIERAGWWAGPRHQLGQLYAQNGDEDKARTVLDAAYAIDPFNVATVNYLRLLDQMATFDKRETEHFILVFDEAADPVMAEYLGEVMERIYDEVCPDFAYEPTRKIIVEVFPTKDQFSVRTAGQPGVESFAAAFGPVIAACTPRAGGETLGLYKWPRVLKHEFTHTLNLMASEHRIPRWLTEGLATWQEDLPIRFQRMGKVLYDRAAERTLFTIDQLPHRIARPQGPNDGETVYTQGAWLARYLESTHGRESIVKLIDAYKRGLTDEDAVKAATGLSTDTLDENFAKWMKEQLADWGYDEETTKKVEELEKKGEALIAEKNYEEALPVWQELAKLRPVETLPHQRLAGLFIRLKDNDKAREHLIELHKNELKDNRYAKRISRMYRDDGDLTQAVKYGLEAVYIDPYDADAHELLIELYEKTGNAEALAREQRVLAAIEKWKAEREG